MNRSHVRGNAKVFVTGRVDADVTFPERYLGRVGSVRGVDIEECGASPRDPFVIVAFDGIGTDGFWLEELEFIDG